MKNYHVTVQRIESITFALEAEDDVDATSRYLMDGDEVHSHTVRNEVTRVEEIA